MTTCAVAAALAAVAGWLWSSDAVAVRARLQARTSLDAITATRPGAVTPVGAVQAADIAEQLATALDAGLPLPVAWGHIVSHDAVAAVLVAGDGEGRAALLALRAALRLTAENGVPAAAVLRAAAVSVRDRLDADAARRAAISGPVAAAWIVASLPVIGPLLGMAIGIDPIGVLTQTGWGRLCGTAGVMFLVAGALWSRRLVIRARAREA